MTAPPFTNGARGFFVNEIAVLGVHVEIAVQAEVSQQGLVFEALEEAKLEHLLEVVDQDRI